MTDKGEKVTVAADPEQEKLIEDIYNKNHKYYWIVKRVFDVVVSLLAIILLSPLMLVILLAIVIDDPHGSPIFRQTRIGRHAKEFQVYKFRTMIVGADKMVDQLMDQNEADGPAFKIKDDPRITGVGKILRKISLDELPQLFNILKGEMTIVGPRPPLPNEVEQYDEFHKLRLMVTPGLTCHWQVQPQRNDISFDDWMKMDMYYIGKRTFLEDIKLIFMTMKVVFKGEGR